MVEGDGCDGRHGCGWGTREGWRVGIRGVVHRHNVVHRVGPDRVLNLGMSVDRIPEHVRWEEE